MVRRFRILVAALAVAALPLAACETIPSSPVEQANRTTLDEQAAIGVNLSYKAFRLAVETGINAGLIKGAVAGRVAELDNRAYLAVQAVDAAYRSGNSASYASAVVNANAAIAAAVAAVPRSN